MGPQEPLRVFEGWSPWVSLENCWLGSVIPAVPGLYRVRRTGEERLDYIGQTGVALRGRLAMLAGLYRAEMPYRDPHTAAPALWALRHARGCTHGPLTADATEPAWDGYLLTVACSCGVVFERWVTPEEAEVDLLKMAGLN